jgi:hypothetical protein
MDPVAAQCTIPAGGDANKGFFLTAVPEGRILWITCVSGWGLDGSEFMGLYLVAPSTAGAETLNDFTISGEDGVTKLFGGLKGGGVEQDQNNNFTGLQAGQFRVAGPVSIVCASSAANTAEGQCNLRGFLE